MVMIVLLNDDLMCATPYAMFLRSRRFGRRPPAAGFAIFRSSLALLESCSPFAAQSSLIAYLRAFFAGDGLLRTLAGTGVGTGALPANREAPTVAQALVAADLDLALDVGGDLTSEVTFDLDVRVDEPRSCATSSSVRSRTRVSARCSAASQICAPSCDPHRRCR